MPAVPLSLSCPGCSTLVPSGDRFCGTCGTPVTESAVLIPGGDRPRFDPWTDLLHTLRHVTLGEYEIKGELGRGGMAAVFLAHDLQLNRHVAIKVMLPGLAYSERMWDRFLAEARMAARLDHPNIVYVHSVKERDRFLYFVMKYIDGRPLDHVLAEHTPLAIATAQTILGDMTRALDHAHGEGVIHRDIKPANIMIDRNGQAIVMDFGIARAHDSEHFTQTGATIGTPAYMSPEQCHGQDVTVASDQYSLGVVAYEMLAGIPPFSGSPIELQIAHMQDMPRPIRELRPDVPPALADAVMRMLAKDPADRWPSLRQGLPILTEGIDAQGHTSRETLGMMIRSGAERPPFPLTPVSPIPSVGAERTPVGASGSPSPAPAISGPNEAPTIISAPRPAAPPVTASKARWVRQTSLAVGAAAAVALGTTLILHRTSASSANNAGSTTAPEAVDALLGDSVVIGHGTDASLLIHGLAPRNVTPDAISLLQLSLGKERMAAGDTVHARLDAFDDGGERVTTHQMVWTTSDPHVVRFAAPGELIAVSAGTATIGVAAGNTKTSRVVTVRQK